MIRCIFPFEDKNDSFFESLQSAIKFVTENKSVCVLKNRHDKTICHVIQGKLIYNQ